ncbi:MAG TPA: hypothetical protein VF273_10520 [Pelobium sp.]
MKASSTQNNRNLLANFDSQLLNILKQDLREQKLKMKAKFIHMATRTYDNELLAIINADIAKMRGILGNAQNNLAQAG